MVIDDWHRVTDTATSAALGFLLDNGCHHLQIIVTSWSRAGLPLSRLRIRDELVEIDCRCFAFRRRRGTIAARSTSVGSQLSRERRGGVDRIDRRVGRGAAAGGAVAARRRAMPTACCDRLSGASDVIGEFLAENVARHPRTRSARVPAGDLDHRADLRRARVGAGRA